MTYLMMLTMWPDGAHAVLNNRTRAMMCWTLLFKITGKEACRLYNEIFEMKEEVES